MSRESSKGDAEKFTTVDFYSAHEGTHGRDGGPYLDEVERINQERVRQAIPNSEEAPNADLSASRADILAAIPGSAGTPLVTEASRVDNSYGNPSVLRHTDKTFIPKPVQTVDILKAESAYSASTVDVTGNPVIPHEPGDRVDKITGEVIKWEDRKPQVNEKAEVSSTSQSMANPLNALVGDTSTLFTSTSSGPDDKGVTAGSVAQKNNENSKLQSKATPKKATPKKATS